MPVPRSTSRPDARRGFTLVEILIVVVILGILAAIVLPQFSNASHQARENTLKDDLRFLRTQIAVYTAQHNETAPGYPAGNTSAPATAENFVEQLTHYTDSSGAVVAASEPKRFGPYLSRCPSNPITGKTGVWIATTTPLPAPDESQDAGWIFNPATQQIKANTIGADVDGVAYSNY